VVASLGLGEFRYGNHVTMSVKPTQVERCEAGPLSGEGLQGQDARTLMLEDCISMYTNIYIYIHIHIYEVMSKR